MRSKVRDGSLDSAIIAAKLLSDKKRNHLTSVNLISSLTLLIYRSFLLSVRLIYHQSIILLYQNFKF
uniref:ANF_receptor domain-containing protein n=1 Tax=Heterorhabditis bacteriophora TaxID=37862 RepID=A0A1I7X6K5_HETBA